MTATLPTLTTAFMRLAATLGAEVNRGAWTHDQARDALAELCHSAPQTAAMDPEARWALIDALADEVGRVAVSAPVSAIHDIRNALPPLMAARQPRAALLLAAYRAADGRLPARDVEQCVDAEIAHFMSRLRMSGRLPARKAANA